MPFTSQELQNIANSVLNYHQRGAAITQSIQNKPLMMDMESNKKPFGGGKENITIPVVGDYTSQLKGYSYNDTVTYANPANTKRASYPWKEQHVGISMTNTELKTGGIHVVDDTNFGKTVESSDQELYVLTDLLEEKVKDMNEGYARSFNLKLWQDGTQDAKDFPGVTSMIVDSPTTGTTGGIDRASNTWWRNRALVGSTKIISSTTLQTLSQTLRVEVRQLRRFSKSQNYKIYAGSTFINLLETEVYAKGLLTQEGFTNNGKTDIGLADISMRGVGTFQYDPTLDDLGFADRAYFIDMNAIQLRPMMNEDKVMHNPARPFNQYVLYRAMTWTGGLVASQLNSCGVYQAA